METRVVVEIKVYALALNSMYANTEQFNVVAIATSEQELKDWYESHILDEPYNNEVGYLITMKEPLQHHNLLHGWQHRADCPWGSHGWWTMWVNEDDILNLDVPYHIGF